ncbi:MAG: ABC transporter ATP-binding protein [Actinobacteria bacterium]|nr:ABC transporter ATP-binding protein [Actinomycetota bacterium]
MSCSMIRLDAVTKRFGATVAVDEASLCVDRGEVVALLGPSGCGKTTLLRLVAGYERPDGGTVDVGGRVVAAPGSFVSPDRRRVGMVFQDYALFPHLTVAENVGFGLPRRERSTRVPKLLSLTRLDDLGRRYPHELSGGQQQRVALARALAPAPELVLLDEPWSNVDPHLREMLRAEVTEIIRPLGVTVVLVTHDREEAFSLADRIALMRDGKVVQEGTSEELYFAPASRWAAEFVGAANVLTGRVVSGVVETPIGAFAANGSSSAATAEVLIRPELLELELDPDGDAEVVAREFRGHDVFYRVRVNGLEVVSQRPSTEVVPLGARVSVRLHDGRVPVLH